MDIQAILASFGSKLFVTGFSRGTKSGVSAKSGSPKPWHMILVADGTAERSFMVEEQIAKLFPSPGTLVRVTADYSEREGRTFMNNARVEPIPTGQSPIDSATVARRSTV